MVATTSWRELCRFDDAALARAVATSIASMEYDVRLSPHPGRTPFIVEVIDAEWADLADVLEEIIDEQIEFDRLVDDRRAGTRHARIVAVITLTGAAEILLLLAIADW